MSTDNNPTGILISSDFFWNVLSDIASIVTVDTKSDYCYLPYWFKRDGTGKIIAYHMNDLPTELTQRIEGKINEIFSQPTETPKTEPQY